MTQGTGIVALLNRLKEIKANQFNMLTEYGSPITTDVPWDEYKQFFKEMTTSGTQPYEIMSDRILGSEETDAELRGYVLNASSHLDNIIGKENTSSVYSEIEIDTLDQLELKADEIIGE